MGRHCLKVLGYEVVCLNLKFTISDMRVKSNVELVGRSASGINIYEYTYAGAEGTRYRGVLAQELLEEHPDAVRLDPETGLYGVAYDLIDVEFEEVL